MKTELVQYERAHAYKILEKNVRDCDIWLTSYPGWEEAVEGWEKYGPAFTLIIDDEIVGCGGVTIIRSGIGEAWMLVSNNFYRYPKTAFKQIRNSLDGIIRSWKLRRVQAFVFKGFEAGCHLLRHLGFENETPDGVKGMGPNGEDMYLFGRVC